MTIARILISIASFSFAMIAGFKTGKNVNPIEEIITYSMDANTMPGVPIPNNEQFNLLIIGVDDAEKPDAKLQSIWLIAYPKNSSKVTMMPVFPSLDNPVQNLILAETFHLHNGKPAQEFWDAMRGTDVWWKGFTVSDKTGLTKLIDSMDGISIGGERQTGTQAVGHIPSWKNDPKIALEQQQIIFEGVCNRIAETKTAKTKTATGMFLEHLSFSKETNSFISDWVSRVATHKRLSCYFPSFDEISVQSTFVTP